MKQLLALCVASERTGVDGMALLSPVGGIKRSFCTRANMSSTLFGYGGNGYGYGHEIGPAPGGISMLAVFGNKTMEEDGVQVGSVQSCSSFSNPVDDM